MCRGSAGQLYGSGEACIAWLKPLLCLPLIKHKDVERLSGRVPKFLCLWEDFGSTFARPTAIVFEAVT